MTRTACVGLIAAACSEFLVLSGAVTPALGGLRTTCHLTLSRIHELCPWRPVKGMSKVPRSGKSPPAFAGGWPGGQDLAALCVYLLPREHNRPRGGGRFSIQLAPLPTQEARRLHSLRQEEEDIALALAMSASEAEAVAAALAEPIDREDIIAIAEAQAELQSRPAQSQELGHGSQSSSRRTSGGEGTSSWRGSGGEGGTCHRSQPRRYGLVFLANFYLFSWSR